jgi:hypothetical protein
MNPLNNKHLDTKHAYRFALVISKEVAMKKSWTLFIALFFLLAPFSFVAGAELAKQGEGTFWMAHTGTYKLLPLGNERSEAIFEAAGLVVEAPENSPLFKATYLVFGSSHRIKDDYEERGSVRYTRPDGDEVFLIYEAKGKIGVERKSKATFVGGTGKCAGITGASESTGIMGLKPPKEGMSAGSSSGKFTWKIP